MKRQIIGMDFGTTNSGMALDDGRGPRILPLDPANANPRVARTALYITNDQQVHIGRDAINTYVDQNVGRPVRMEKVWVGEIEVRAEDMYYVTDVYVFTDVLSPGRLFLSIKSGLRDPDYVGTVVGQFFYPLEDLITLYLTVTKKRAEKMLGRELKEVVLGRPVRFAFEPEKDRLAQARLLDAAFRAGYERVYLQYVPIAAAYHYAATAGDPQNILVFDFGGGTLNVTVMRVGPGWRQILATGGIPVAGDVFDQKLVRAKLPQHFGEGSHYTTRHKVMPVPGWIYDVFSDWQRIFELQLPENRRVLDEIAQTAHRPREIEALRSLIADNYALQMFDAAEQAKRRLSEDMGTLIHFSGPKFSIRQLVTRTDFEAIIRPEVDAIDAHLDEILVQAELTAGEIDSVIRTGGSAEIPVFRRLLMQKFGADKIRSLDIFSSVTSGLSLIAREVAAGALDLRAYTAADLPSRPTETNANVSPANLQLLQKRISLAEGEEEVGRGGPRLVICANGNRVRCTQVRGAPDAPPHALAYASTPQWVHALTADYDDRLLLLTGFYRFLLVTPRQLDELRELEMGLEDLHHFRKQEEVTAVCRWADVVQHAYLTLITSRGFARSYKVEGLRESIEGPAPFQFDHALPGVPVSVLGTELKDQIVVYADNGRALRFPMNHNRLRVRGLQAINNKDGERIMGGFRLDAAAELLLVTREGYGRRIDAADLPLADKPNEKPPILSSRKPVQIMAPWSPTARLVTNTRVVPLSLDKLPRPTTSTKTYRLLKLNQAEIALALLVE